MIVTIAEMDSDSIPAIFGSRWDRWCMLAKREIDSHMIATIAELVTSDPRDLERSSTIIWKADFL